MIYTDFKGKLQNILVSEQLLRCYRPTTRMYINVNIVYARYQ